MGVLDSLSGVLPDTSVLLVFLCVLLLTTWFLFSPRNLPPGPWGKPLFGHILDIEWSTDYHLTLLEYRRKYGDIFRLRFGYRPVIVLNSAAAIKEALVEKSEFFSQRPNWMHKINAVIQSKGVIFNLHDWQFTRKFTVSTMRDFGVGKSPTEEKCIEEIDVLTEEFTKYNSKPFNCQLLMANAVSNIICGVVFNKRFDYDDENFQEIMGNINTVFRGNPLYTVTNTIDGAFKLAMLLSTSKTGRQIANVKKTREFVREMIEQHRAVFDPDNIQDFTDLFLLSQQDQSGGKSKISEEDAFRMIIDLFNAGTETTSTTLQWFFIYMMYNQEVQEKCRKEIQETIGSERAPTMGDRGKMIYTEATLLEVQRIATIAPLALPHTATRETTVGGYTIPKDAWVIANLYACHHDHDVWGDPDNFRPERWIDEHGALRKHQAFIPFSLGKRICAGEGLARMEIFLFSVAFLQRFRFKMADTLPSIVGHLGTTLLTQPFDMIAEPLR